MKEGREGEMRMRCDKQTKIQLHIQPIANRKKLRKSIQDSLFRSNDREKGGY